ncbi:MAG: NADH-quinone oxidoreductase subunit M, partial [Candidatus Omnitrophica bacterium]|nr:NADH-quinone oxidoreductase subunit M [Candidatus Omnitrophota bacterium]
TLGLIAATLYSLRLIRRAFHGPRQDEKEYLDLTLRERALNGAFALGLIWLGVYPQPAINAVTPTLKSIQSSAATPMAEHNAISGESQ